MNHELLDRPRYAAYVLAPDTLRYLLVGESSSLACACALAQRTGEERDTLAYVLNRESMVITYCDAIDPALPGEGARRG